MRYLTKIEMQDLDERMIHQYKIPLAKMVDYAARALVALLRARYPRARRVVALAGVGNNGGGIIHAARLLYEEGCEVCVVLSRPELFLKPVPKVKFEKLPDEVMVGVSEEAEDDELADLLARADVILDGLLGYGIEGNPEGEVARLIRLANQAGTPILSLDLPSGLDPDEGAVYSPVIQADATLTLALPKKGLAAPSMPPCAGNLFVADIGVPEIWFIQEGVARPEYESGGYVALAPYEEKPLPAPHAE